MGQKIYVGIISITRTTFTNCNFEMLDTIHINKGSIELVLSQIEIGIKPLSCYTLEYLSIRLVTVECYNVRFFPLIICNFDNHSLYIGFLCHQSIPSCSSSKVVAFDTIICSYFYDSSPPSQEILGKNNSFLLAEM